MKKSFFTVTCTFLSLIGGIRAQESEDIGTETVTVVKPYAPTVSDAFKLKSVPQLNDSIALSKKAVSYTINSVPVASTFSPAKAKAARVEKVPPPTLYNSYASVGLGNFNNAMVDFYTSREIGREEHLFDVGLSHHSSRGDIDSTPLDADFYNTDLDVSLSKKDREMDWGVSLGLDHSLYNWYGLESGAFTDTQVAAIDPSQNYFNAQLEGRLELKESFFKQGKIKLQRFWDGLDSGENRAVLTTAFEVPLTTETIQVKTNIDYLGGSFGNSSLNATTNTTGIDYGQLILGVNPGFVVLRDELTLNLGANFVYGTDLERSNGSFFIYPAVTASYRLKGDEVIAYGGIEGDLRQNSYHSLFHTNNFVSPTLELQPTDQQYEGYLGLKGQLGTNVGYNIKGSYTAENRKPLFLLNPQNLFRGDEGYAYGNSFQVFYDDLKTLGIFGEINVNLNRNFTLGLNAEYFNYSTETDNPAWNLPEIKGSLFLDYQINAQWYAGANLFYIGERQDLQSQAVPNTPANLFPSTIVTIDGFFDANAHLGYRFNEQLSVFARLSNIANNNYERWFNFRVQGFQALAGVAYKFDF
ncbi:TonB-dependent receptor [Flagellimonas sp. DF-77]|uniref:TonB-dependent receptor n=1 Tax=Flagellimonas algarum TaxID=3230298 RepID=UPI003392D103